MISTDYEKSTKENNCGAATGSGCGIHYDPNEAPTPEMYGVVATPKPPEPERERKPYIGDIQAKAMTKELVARYTELECDYAELLGEKYKYMAALIKPYRYDIDGGIAHLSYNCTNDASKRVQEKINSFLREVEDCIGEPLRYYGTYYVGNITADNLREEGIPDFSRVKKLLPTLGWDELGRMRGLLCQESALRKWGNMANIERR